MKQFRFSDQESKKEQMLVEKRGRRDDRPSYLVITVRLYCTTFGPSIISGGFPGQNGGILAIRV